MAPANAEAESNLMPMPSPDRKTSILPVSGWRINQLHQEQSRQQRVNENVYLEPAGGVLGGETALDRVAVGLDRVLRHAKI